MNEFDFEECLAFSRGNAAANEQETIQKMLIGCVKVERAASVVIDKSGIDYIATLRRGATVNIDAKRRRKGCSRWWKSSFENLLEPELSLEEWSVIPKNGYAGKVGWTLDESKKTDYTFHVFDKSDTEQVFLLPFQLLRMAFARNIYLWKKSFRGAPQDNGSWESSCIFVPAACVMQAVKAEMKK